MIRFIQVLIFTCACLISQAQVNIVTNLSSGYIFYGVVLGLKSSMLN